VELRKMHGLGNCFVVTDVVRRDLPAGIDLPALARHVCDRNTGLGADGLIVIGRAEGADLRMSIFNEDGSEAEMCGNGIRCVARYAIEEGLTEKSELAIATGAGLIRTRLVGGERVEVDMGAPTLAPAVVEGGRRFSIVSMGNPHAIAFVDDLAFDWRAEGAIVERAPSFPNRTNVEFVKIRGPREAEVKVWERGCGETLACGTGACAVAVAGAVEGKLERAPLTIRLPGGPLDVHWTEGGSVLMTGPAVTICKGVYLDPTRPSAGTPPR
jgi:diaminopimelate epimerase